MFYSRDPEWSKSVFVYSSRVRSCLNSRGEWLIGMNSYCLKTPWRWRFVTFLQFSRVQQKQCTYASCRLWCCSGRRQTPGGRTTSWDTAHWGSAVDPAPPETEHDPQNNGTRQDQRFGTSSKVYLNRWKNIGSCIIGSSIGCRLITFQPWIPLCDLWWWDRWPGVVVFVGLPRSTPPLVDNDHHLAACRWNRRLQRWSCRDNHRSYRRKHDSN